MTTLRLHSYTSDPGKENDGTVSCDYRGASFIGDREGDHHHTLVEVDLDENDPRVSALLKFGPQANKALALFEAKVVDGLHVGGQVPRLRVGVWDKQAPR